MQAIRRSITTAMERSVSPRCTCRVVKGDPELHPPTLGDRLGEKADIQTGLWLTSVIVQFIGPMPSNVRLRGG